MLSGDQKQKFGKNLVNVEEIQLNFQHINVVSKTNSKNKNTGK